MAKDDGADDGADEDEINEARRHVVARKPQAPTKAEIDVHFPLRAEYRNWYPHCVFGKGISAQHKQDKDKFEGLGHTVSMEYLFMIPKENDQSMDAVLVDL